MNPKATPKTLMPLARAQKLDGDKNLENNPRGNQVAHLQS